VKDELHRRVAEAQRPWNGNFHGGPALRLSAYVVGFLSILLAGCGTYSPLDSHYNRGVEYYDQGRLADAIREYRLALDDQPGHVRARFNLAACFHDQGKNEEAEREYRKVLELHPENARALVSLAALRPDEEARTLLEQACKADPDSGFPRSSLAAWHERKGDVERAMAEYRASVAIEPGHAAGHGGIARLLIGQQNLDAAAAAYDLALAAEPDDVAALVGSSEVRERKGDAKIAALHLERALVHARGRADLWARLAALYESLDRLEDAVAALWEARAIDPKSPVGPRLRALYEKLAARER